MEGAVGSCKGATEENRILGWVGQRGKVRKKLWAMVEGNRVVGMCRCIAGVLLG